MKNIFFIVYVFYFLLTGCTKYLDRTYPINHEIGNKIYDLTIKKDYNFFDFKYMVGYKLDNEYYSNVLFSVELPKKLVNLDIVGMSEFSFYYSDNQCIYLVTDFQKKFKTNIDTIYSPSLKEIEVITDQFGNGKFSFNLREKKHLEGRKFFLLKRGNAEILLFNIKDKNVETFLKAVKSLKLK